MKRSTIKLLVVCLLFSATFTRCKCDDDEIPPVKSMIECVKATTWVPVSVTKAGSSVLSDFSSFKITFDAAATGGQIITGPTNPETKTVTYSVGENAITVTGGLTGWSTTLVTASTNGDACSEFKFTVNITNPKTGAADYAFVLKKQ